MQELVDQVVNTFRCKIFEGETPIEINTPLGRVRGTTYDGMNYFRSVPYGEDMGGANRFKTAIPKKPWDGVLDCTKFGPFPYQTGDAEFTEDCLNVNIWAPSDAKEKGPLPVYAFIHGGGLTQGNNGSPSYEATALAKRGIVVVSIGYRLCGLGFLALESIAKENGYTGNMGLMDLITALHWIRENIGAFGGDGSKITVGGESAGGSLTAALMFCPRAKGLFQRAIIQSGAVIGHLPLVAQETSQTKELALAKGKEIAKKFGVEDSAEGLEKLRSVPAEEIIKMTCWEPTNMAGPQPDHLWICPDGVLYPSDPFQAFKEGKFNFVDIIIGSNIGEGWLFYNEQNTIKDFEYAVRKVFNESADEYLEKHPIDDQHDVHRRIMDLANHIIFKDSLTIIADHTVDAGCHAFLYHFDFLDPSFEGLGITATHGTELKYINGACMDHLRDRKDVMKMTDIMQTAWSNFVKTGNPNGPSLPAKWEEYTKGCQMNFYLSIDPHMEPITEMEDIEFARKHRFKGL